MFLLGVSASASQAEKPPSFILVVVDTLRADFVGTYGFDGDSTPHIDELSRESVVFERCFAPAPWTKPSVASLFTSLHPDTHGLTNHDGLFYGSSTEDSVTGILSPRALTMAESLREAGYQTAAFVANPWMLKKYGFAQGFDVYDDRFTGNTTPSDVVFDAARKWLRTRSPDRAFFLYVHLMDVHGPYDAPQADFVAVRSMRGVKTPARLSDRDLTMIPRYLCNYTDCSSKPAARLLSTWRARYAAGVHAFDRRLSFFLDSLRHMNALDDAYLIVTSDHGEELHEHRGWDHGRTLNYHQLHVPLIVRVPGERSDGRRVANMCSLLDVMPTVLSLARIQLSGLQGADLSHLLGRNAPEADRAILSSATKGSPTRYALTTSAYKLIADERTRVLQLFDITADPREERNLAASRKDLTQQVYGRLRGQLERIRKQPSLYAAPVQVSDEERRRLEALGYAEPHDDGRSPH